jgi:ABC-2 type transport system permease protein
MNALAASPSGRFLPAVWKLIRLRLLISFNSFKHAKPIRKILSIVAILGLLAFAGMIMFVSWILLDFLRSPQLTQYVGADVTPFLQAMPVLIFTGLFLGILLSSFGVLLQALYLSGDMDFLLSTPVPIRAVFVTKLLQAVLPNFGLIALFGLPVLYGLGLAGHYSILYFPLVLLTMIALALAAAGLSALLVMLVARIFPARRAAEILGFVGALLAFTCSQAGNIYNSFGHSTNVSGAQVSNMFSLLMRFNTPWLPLNWAGQGLVALGEGRWLTALLLVTLTLGLSAVIFMFALGTAERLYYSGWAGMQVVARRKKKARAIRSAAPVAASLSETAAVAGVPALGLGRLLPAPVRGIIWKDFLLLRRDLRNLSQLISPLIFGVVYSFMIFNFGNQSPAGQGGAPDWFMNSLGTLLTYGNVGMSLFVGWMLLARLSGMAFSSEGRNYWMMKAAPLRAAHLLIAKFLVAYLPTFALGLFFLTGISLLQKIPFAGFMYSLLAVAMCLAGMNGILLAFGVLGANFKWEDPRKMSAGGLGCLGQFLTMLYLPLAFGLFIGPLWLVSAFNFPQLYGYLAGAIIGTLATAACAFLPPWLVQGKVARLAES